MPRTRTRSLLALSVVALLLVGCSSADLAHDESAPGDSASGEAEVERESADGGDADTPGLGGSRAGDHTDEATGQPSVPPASTAGATSGDRLIKEGTMTIEVPVDGFEQGFDRAVSAARALGGSVVASTSSSTEDGGTAGSVTIRVPVDRYEDLLVGVGAVGEVLRRDITTKDVTAEFTDIESRLRHARAQERFYLALLEEAEGVSDAIAVQQQLDGIQSTIEQLQGRLNLLEDQTSFSTLTVELVEPGTSPVLASTDPRPHLGAYVDTAQDAFVTVVGSILVLLVALTPVLVPAAALGLLWRAMRRPRPATAAAE